MKKNLILGTLKISILLFMSLFIVVNSIKAQTLYNFNYDLSNLSNSYFPLFDLSPSYLSGIINLYSQYYPHYNQIIWNYNGYNNIYNIYPGFYPDQIDNYQSYNAHHNLNTNLKKLNNENSDEIEIVDRDDNGKIFTFNVGEEFIVKLSKPYYNCFYGTCDYGWGEEKKVSLENGFGFKRLDLDYDFSSLDYKFHYQAAKTGENDLIINLYSDCHFPGDSININDFIDIILPDDPSFEEQEVWHSGEIVDTFKILIKIIE